MDNTAQLLAQLHDIHLPLAIDLNVWPFSRYLLLTILIVIISLGLAFYWHAQWKARRRARLIAKLQVLGSAGQFAELSTFLKRVAIKAYPRENVGALQGKDWLAFLDRTDHKNAALRFQSEIGELLLEIPYQRKVVMPAQDGIQSELIQIITRWICKHYV